MLYWPGSGGGLRDHNHLRTHLSSAELVEMFFKLVDPPKSPMSFAMSVLRQRRCDRVANTRIKNALHHCRERMQMGTGEFNAGIALRWTSIPSRGE